MRCRNISNTGISGIGLYMHPANERRRYNVTSSLIGWGHTQNDPWNIYMTYFSHECPFHVDGSDNLVCLVMINCSLNCCAISMNIYDFLVAEHCTGPQICSVMCMPYHFKVNGYPWKFTLRAAYWYVHNNQWSNTQIVSLDKHVCHAVYWFNSSLPAPHICVGARVSIDSINGLLPVWRQAITWTIAGLSSTGFLGGLNWNSIIFIQENAFENVVCQSPKWQEFFPGDDLTHWGLVTPFGDIGLCQHWLR